MVDVMPEKIIFFLNVTYLLLKALIYIGPYYVVAIYAVCMLHLVLYVVTANIHIYSVT